jgi:chromosomal replication initiation ATPase DnaA
MKKLKEIIEKYDLPENKEIISELKALIDTEPEVWDAINIISEVMGLPPETILSTGRKQEIVYMRYILFYALYTYCNINTIRLKKVTHYDHSTILYGINKVRFDIETEYADTKIILERIFRTLYEC